MPGQEATITATDGVASMYGSMVQQYKEMTDGELDRHGYKDKLRQLADSCDGSTLLDVGCGHGYMLQWLLEELGVPAGALGGHDLSPEMLKEAAKVLPGVRLTQGTCMELSKAGWEGVGAVMCQFVIQHLQRTEMPQAIQMMSNVLKKGGALYLGFWAGDGTSNWGPTVTGNLYSREEVFAALEAAKFASIEIEIEDDATEEYGGKCMAFVHAVKE